ncbi:MAG TPA: hypothetical protein VK705_08980 [Ferruginibacter sp.]|jgi:hypothetical protein|nr:hypothetical protein [Ferruginibacter sp.]
MDKELQDAIMALPQMKERIKRLYAYADEKYKVLPENIKVSIRLTSKTVANGKEDDTSIDINNHFREMLHKPIGTSK